MAELIRYAKLQRRGRSLWPDVVCFCIALLLSVAGESVLPLGTAFTAAIWMCGYTPVFALCGAICGSLLLGRYAACFALLIYAVAGLLFWCFKKRLHSVDKLLLLAGAQALCLPIFFLNDTDTLMEGLATLSLAILAAVVLKQAIRACRAIYKHRWPPESEQICLCGAGCLLVYALSGLSLGTFSISALAAAFFAILTVRTKGITAVAAAVMLGTAAVLSGVELLFLGCLGACTLGACALRGLGKWGIVSGFLACAILVWYAFQDSALGALEAGSAALLYACIPVKRLNMPDERAKNPAEMAAQRECRRLRRQLREIAGILEAATPLFQSEDGFAMRQVAAISDALKHIAAPQRKVHRAYELGIGAACCPKGGSDRTGDCMGMRETSGRVLLLLSDGMGSGMEAHKESTAAVALLGDLLGVGFALPEALECVNRLLISRNAGVDMFATLDVMVMDLENGEARFVKYGASPSYILRQGKVYTLYAEALPAGILEEAQPAIHVVKLKRSDAVVLMTDGVSDALGSGLTAAIIEEVGRANTSDDAAQALLSVAREKSDADDMSVIVARVS